MSTSNAIKKPGRFVSLDVVRFFAALSVVFSHWRHFYFSPDKGGIDLANAAVQPLYFLFWPLYEYGYLAVELFFCLSGFVFYYLYANAVRDGRVTSDTFMMLRFSRLGPLHYLTLGAVIALQYFYMRQHGLTFNNINTDLRQIVLHLLLINSWPPNFVIAFNAPAWSISIEVMLYVAFFMLCYARLTAPIILTVFSIFGAVIWFKLEMAGRGFHSFFMGGLCYYIVQRQQGGNNYSWRYLGACAAAILLAAAGLMLVRQNSPLVETIVVSVAFPALILTLALLDHRIEKFTRPIGWIGNLSYSSYLLHFPLQLVLVVTAFSLGVTIDYASPLTLLAFMSVLIALSLWSYYGYEKPVQRYLRNRMSPRTEAARPAIDRRAVSSPAPD